MFLGYKAYSLIYCNFFLLKVTYFIIWRVPKLYKKKTILQVLGLLPSIIHFLSSEE